MALRENAEWLLEEIDNCGDYDPIELIMDMMLDYYAMGKRHGYDEAEQDCS